jgi:hypothetical protein
MTLKHRRMLYIAFFILFFILAPIIVKLAQGYKFNWNSFNWQKTGVLFLESKPNKADIYLNGEKQKQQTEALFKNIAPGEYQIDVKKDGYLSWSKKLKITAGETTFAQYIRLFKENIIPEKILDEKITAISETIQNKVAIASAKDNGSEIFVLNLGNDSIKKITKVDFPINEININQTATQFALKNDGNWQILTQNIFGSDKIYKIPSAKYAREKISFDPNNNLIFYALSNIGIEKIDLNSNKTEFLALGKILDFYVSSDENKIYYIKNTNSESNLFSISLNGQKNEELISNLAISEKYKFNQSPQGIINIINSDKQTIIIFDNKKKLFDDEKTIINNVNKISWHSDNISLIYGNNNEIWTYEGNKKEDKKQLIARLGEKIENFWWYGVPTHLLYLTADGLFITELITNDFARDTIKISAIKNTKQIWITEKGDKIYWINNDGEFFESQIQ